MPPTVTGQSLFSSQTTEEGSDGVKFLEDFLVTGCSGGRFTLIEAMTASGLPQVGDSIDTPSGTLWCNKRTPRRIAEKNKTDVRVTIEWGPPTLNFFNGPPQPIVEFDGSSRAVRTNYDADGQLITIAYNTGKDTVGEVTGQQSVGVLMGTWTESSDPESRLLPLVNKINSVPFRGQPKYTWWVRRIRMSKQRTKPGYIVGVEIEYDPLSFVATAVYRDVHGFIPNDVTTPNDRTVGGYKPNGYVNVLINGTADLNQLNIPNVQ